MICTYIELKIINRTNFLNYGIIRKNLEFKPLLMVRDVNQHLSTLSHMSIKEDMCLLSVLQILMKEN